MIVIILRTRQLLQKEKWILDDIRLIKKNFGFIIYIIYYMSKK